jgi:hypothetical protein
MRAVMIAMLAFAALGFFGPSAVWAAPANGAVIGEPAAAGQMTEKARYYRRQHRRRPPYYVYRPGPSYTYRPYDPYGAETLHQLSQENEERAQRYRSTWSDIRLKHDIVLLGRRDNGLGYYRFKYNGSNEIYVGVIAQEVAKIVPSAVSRGYNGYLRVDYDRVGVTFMTWNAWKVQANATSRLAR